MAYQLYQRKFSGPRWEALVKKGAKKQRLLWASTSVKNPAYPDTLYVAPLIGPDTVSNLIFYFVRLFIVIIVDPRQIMDSKFGLDCVKELKDQRVY